MVMTGSAPDKAIKNIVKTMETSKSNATRLVMTEQAYFTTLAQKDCFQELDVEEFEVVGTLDGITCTKCGSRDGEHYPLKYMESGVNAPPFHPYCRCTTCPYFDDMDGYRASRNEEGKTVYKVPANMTYSEWKKAFVDDIIKGEKEYLPRHNSKGDYGVCWEYVHSREYSNKFKKLSNDVIVQKSIENRVKWALNNRDGVNTEELYAVDLDTGKEIARITDQHIPEGIMRTKKFESALYEADKSGHRILLIHNHPKGLPPSIADINLLLNSKNITGITAGHDGSIYYYTKPRKQISDMDREVALKHFNGYSELTAIEKALNLLSKKYEFYFEQLQVMYMTHEDKDYLIDDRPIKFSPEIESMSKEELEQEFKRRFGKYWSDDD